MLTLSYFSDYNNSSAPTLVDHVEWKDVVQLLTDTHIISPDKTHVPLFSSACFFSTRSTAILVTMLVLDFDDGTDYFTVRNQLDEFEFVAYSSFSHTTEHHKFRIVLPLEKSINKNEYKQLWKLFSAKVDNKNDPIPSNSASIFYLPSCPSERISEAFNDHHEGKWINPKEYDLTIAETPIYDDKKTYNKDLLNIKCPAPCADGSRTQTLVSFARSLVGFHNLNKQDAINVCRIWNKTNIPPLEDNKIIKTVNSIAKYEGK